MTLWGFSSYLFTFGAGFVTCFLLIRVGVPHFAAHLGDAMAPADAPPPVTHASPRRQLVAIVVIVTALVFVGIGTVLIVNDRAADQAKIDRASELTSFSRCIQTWGDTFIEKINAARDARAEYDAANQARSDAFAKVFNIVIALRLEPPQATLRDLDAALDYFRITDAAVKTTAKGLPDKNTARYVSPTFACGTLGGEPSKAPTPEETPAP